jgi:hypothetical protein
MSDSIKVKEYDKDDISEDSFINANAFLNNKKETLNYFFDLSILNELIVIHEKKLYILQIPIGLELETIGLNFDATNRIVRYRKDLNITGDNLVIDLKECEESKINLSTKYIMANLFISTNSLNTDILERYAKQMKNIFDIDVILGKYDL